MTDNPFDVLNYEKSNPSVIVQGFHAGWIVDVPYDDAEYSLKYLLRQVVGTGVIEIAGARQSVNGSLVWVFEAPSSTSSGWTVETDGEWRWDLSVTRLSDSNTAIIQTGFIDIFRSVSDRRSHAEIMLAKINSILQGRADSDVESYSIKQRSISRMGIRELTMWRDYYLAELRRTGGSVNDGKSRSKTDTVRVRFV